MALHSVPTPTRTFDPRHTADDCAVCSALTAGVTAMVARTGSCDGLREHELVEACGLTRGVFARHMGDLRRCLTTSYARAADTALDRLEDHLAESPTLDEGLREGIVAAIDELDRSPGAAYLCFVAADRSRDPVMWQARSEMRERLVQSVSTAPFHDALEPVQAEVFAGALQDTIRRRIVADGDTIDEQRLQADVGALVDVFQPWAA